MNGQKSARLWVAGVVVLLTCVGCGGRTGLWVPEPPPEEPPESEETLSRVCVDAEVLAQGPIDVALQTTASLARVDVALLIDATASMQDEITQIQSTLRDVIVPALSETIPDTFFSVSSFQDFPAATYGDPFDRPFVMRLPVSESLDQVQAAVDGIRLGNGRDDPESHVEALFQLATGAGFADLVPPSSGCPAGGNGYACFRRGALPLVLMVTDAPMHNGPAGVHPYANIFPERPRQYADAITALNVLRARVISLNSGDDRARQHLEELARDTNSLDGDGEPLVFDIGASGRDLDDDLVDAFRIFAEETPFDASAVAEASGEPATDAAPFVESVVPERAEPASGAQGIDLESGSFEQVRPGTRLVFEISFDSEGLAPGPEERLLQLRIRFLADELASLGSEDVLIRVPPIGESCQDS